MYPSLFWKVGNCSQSSLSVSLCKATVFMPRWVSVMLLKWDHSCSLISDRLLGKFDITWFLICLQILTSFGPGFCCSRHFYFQLFHKMSAAFNGTEMYLRRAKLILGVISLFKKCFKVDCWQWGQAVICLNNTSRSLKLNRAVTCVTAAPMSGELHPAKNTPEIIAWVVLSPVQANENKNTD